MNTLLLEPSAPLALAVTQAIKAGDLPTLHDLLGANPGLAAARIGGECKGIWMSRSLLHVLTDWPGNWPNAAATAAMLIGAGADVNARFVGTHTETPLHWAASSDDTEVIDVLVDAGADIDARGAVIADGTPLTDAVAFGQWKAARRLIERGATSSFRESAALGLIDRVQQRLTQAPPPTPQAITEAFWYACHGGQRREAEYLFNRGANLNWIGYDSLTPLDAAMRSGAIELAAWLARQGGRNARANGPGSHSSRDASGGSRL